MHYRYYRHFHQIPHTRSAKTLRTFKYNQYTCRQSLSVRVFIQKVKWKTQKEGARVPKHTITHIRTQTICNLPFTILSDKRFPMRWTLAVTHSHTDHWIGMRLLYYLVYVFNTVDCNDINHKQRKRRGKEWVSEHKAVLYAYKTEIYLSPVISYSFRTAVHGHKTTAAAVAASNIVLLITISDFVIHLCFAVYSSRLSRSDSSCMLTVWWL